MDDQGREGRNPVESEQRLPEEARRQPSPGRVRPPSVPTQPKPSSGLPGEPADPTEAAWYRFRAESFGDLAAEMAEEGLLGMAYGAGRKAGHYGLLALECEARRASIILPRQPGEEGEASRFIVGLLVSLLFSGALWYAVVRLALWVRS